MCRKGAGVGVVAEGQPGEVGFRDGQAGDGRGLRLTVPAVSPARPDRASRSRSARAGSRRLTNASPARTGSATRWPQGQRRSCANARIPPRARPCADGDACRDERSPRLGHLQQPQPLQRIFQTGVSGHKTLQQAAQIGGVVVGRVRSGQGPQSRYTPRAFSPETAARARLNPGWRARRYLPREGQIVAAEQKLVRPRRTIRRPRRHRDDRDEGTALVS